MTGQHLEILGGTGSRCCLISKKYVQCLARQTRYRHRRLTLPFAQSEAFTYDVSASDAQEYGVNHKPDFHGYSGPVKVSFQKFFYGSSSMLFMNRNLQLLTFSLELFFDGLNYLGVPTVFDPNECNTAGGMYLPMDLDPTNQTRFTARIAHYEPVKARPDYFVLVNQHVLKLIFEEERSCYAASEDWRIIGVEVRRERLT